MAVDDAAWVAALTLLVLQAGFLLPPLGYAVVLSRSLLAVKPGSRALARALAPQLAGQVLKGRKVARGVRLIIIPATPLIYRQAMDQGLLAVFMEAGAVIGPPTCGPCLGGHMGILAPGETAIATTNRNFTGRMGHPQSKVYLANPAVTAASAVNGRICGPYSL